MEKLAMNPAVVVPLLGASAGLTAYKYWKKKGGKGNTMTFLKNMQKKAKMKSAVVKKPLYKAKKGGKVPKKK